MNRYIIINPKDLSVSVSRERETTLCVPTNIGPASRSLSPIEEKIYFDILYSARYAEDHRRGITNIRYKLHYPDPWLIALAMLMWQGIVQGMTWDAVKLLINKALNVLRGRQLAPDISTRTRQSASETDLGFRYVKYSTTGKKQYDMFVGLRRVHRALNNTNIRAVSESVIDKGPTLRIPREGTIPKPKTKPRRKRKPDNRR